MRELTRFRSDFQEKYSIRSKFLRTLAISEQLQDLIETNFEILKQEKRVLKVFQQQKNSLHFHRLGPQSPLRHSEDMIVERYLPTEDIASQFQ